MKYLAIDTSGKDLIVIAVNGDKEEIFFDPQCGLNHSVALMPAVEKTVKSVGLDLKDVDFFACTLGAGSFTGIRIGVATVKALCFAFNKPCLPLTTFDAIAYNEKSGKVLAVIDAKHDHYYCAGYKDGVVSIAPMYIGKAEMEKLSEEYKLLSLENIKDVNCQTVSLISGIKKYIVRSIDRISYDLEKLSPVYVRKSQAEEGR